MVLKQKGKPEKGKKPVRGAPRQFSDHREFPDGPIEEFEDLRVRDSGSDSENDSECSESECESVEETVPVKKATAKTNTPTANTATTKPNTPNNPAKPAAPNAPKELSRREREAIQKEQARQHYLKMKEKEDAARLALVRKQREEAAAKHAEEMRAKEAAKRR